MADRSSNPPADETLFREALARLAGGVAVAACWDGNTPKGLLVSSLTGLSVEPPRVLFCVRKASSSHDAFLRTGTCALSILAQEHRKEAELFSRSDHAAQRFASPDWRLSRPAAPEHRHALASLDGDVDQRIDAGTHTIVILGVRAVRVRDAAPLVYYGRRFHGLPVPQGVA